MEQSGVDSSPKVFTCLVADDSEFARKNIGKIVSTLGGTVIGEAKDGEEAVDLYMRFAPDLVLLDVTMPVLDGVGTLRKILTANRDAKVIIVSAISHKEMIWKAICIGAKHYLTKPFSPDYARIVIESVIRNSHGGVK